MKNKRVQLVLFALLTVMAVAFSLSTIHAEKSRYTNQDLTYPSEDFSDDTEYRVLSVVDGDTIKIEYKGRSETVRLIGIDTPETVNPSWPLEIYAKEASAFTKNLLVGETVYLRFDIETRGKYDRLLAYIFRAPDGLFVNLEIVRQGYGNAYLKYPFKYKELFRRYESRARESKKGLWGAASSASTSDVKSENISEQKAPSRADADDDSTVTVYVTKSGTKYHTESCRWGNISMPLSEARERYSPCRSCNPPQ